MYWTTLFAISTLTWLAREWLAVLLPIVQKAMAGLWCLRMHTRTQARAYACTARTHPRTQVGVGKLWWRRAGARGGGADIGVDRSQAWIRSHMHGHVP